MSLTDLPRDVHALVLPYLPTNIIYLQYQLVCTEWYTLAAEYLTVFDLKYFGTAERSIREAEKILLLIGKRFPNLLKIHLQRVNASDHNTLEFSNIKDLTCSKIQLITLLNMYEQLRVVFCYTTEPKKAAWWRRDILKRFPNYRAINASTLSEFNTAKQLLEYLKEMEINTLYFSEAVKREAELSAIIDRALPTVTHIQVDIQYRGGLYETHRGNITQVWKLLSERINNYTGEVHIKNIISSGDKDIPWDTILPRTPKLEFLSANTITLAQAQIVVQHCPNLTELQLGYWEGPELDVVLNGLPIQVLRLRQKPFPFPPSVGKVPKLHVSGTFHDSRGIEHFHSVKDLFMDINNMDRLNLVISHCHNVETVFLSPIKHVKFAKKDIIRLVEACPKLRFIHNVKSSISAPREMGVVDVMRWREELRPKKRAKKK